MPRFLSELRRRNVWRAAALYAAAAWLLVQVATQVFPFFDIPAWVVRWIVVAALIGFPFWVAFAWFYEVTPEGIKRESDVDHTASIAAHTGKRLDRWIIAVLALAVVLLLANTFIRQQGSQAGRNRAAANSIAVLPFANVSSDKEQEYFADGISEDVLDLLTKVAALRVAARTSSFAFKGKGLNVQEIGRQLNVANVLQGSVRKAGNEVRITAQLVHADDGYQVWSQSWDRKLDDVFAIQDEIAADVTRELKVKLLGAAPTTRQTQPAAYDLYLQARELGRRLTLESLKQSDSLYQLVLEMDPRYVPAWTEMGFNSARETIIGPCCTTVQGLRRAQATIAKGLAIDPGYAPGYAVAGRVALLQADLKGAARYLERALSLDANDLSVLSASAALLESLNRLPESIAISNRVVARDPVNIVSISELARTNLYAGHYDDAIAYERRVLSLSPNHNVAHYTIGAALLLQGKAVEALAEMQQESDEGWRLVGLALVYHALGRTTESDAALKNLIMKWSKDAAYNIAYIYAYRGDADGAFEWLDKAVQFHDSGVPSIPVQNMFANLHSDRRWLPFLRRIGEAPEQLARIGFRVQVPEG